jgi:hypothetical protein
MPPENASTITRPSWPKAVSSAPSISSASLTLTMPTEEPSRAGLTNSGSPSAARRSRTPPGSVCHSGSRTAA